ncbi:MAG: hypothetical protein EXS13_07285 [Planctomycetes bacterium]|nr:hypothetical protein [Planctomycetota bacterium]
MSDPSDARANASNSDPNAPATPAGAVAGGGSGEAPTGAKRPSFPRQPDPVTLRNAPELKKLIYFGGGFLILAAVALFYRPTREEPSAAPTAAPAVESPDEHAKRVATAFGGALPKMVDGVDFEQSHAYLQVVSELSKFSVVNVHERTKDWLDWSVAVSTPGALRGNFVRVRGVIGRIDTIKLFQPAGDVEDIYRFFVGEPDGTEAVVVDMVRRPAETPAILREAVDFEGVFIRTVGFDSAKTGKLQEVPYVVGVNMTIRRTAPVVAGVSKVVWIALVAIGALLVTRRMMRTKPRSAGRHPTSPIVRPGTSLRELHEIHEWQATIARARQESQARKSPQDPASRPEPKS